MLSYAEWRAMTSSPPPAWWLPETDQERAAVVRHGYYRLGLHSEFTREERAAAFVRWLYERGGFGRDDDHADPDGRLPPALPPVEPPVATERASGDAGLFDCMP